MVSERHYDSDIERDEPYEELEADAGDEEMIRQQAAEFAAASQPEAEGGTDDIEDASPDEVEVPTPYGESIEKQIRPFEDATASSDEPSDGPEAGIEGETPRVRARLDEIEREVDAELDRERE